MFYSEFTLSLFLPLKLICIAFGVECFCGKLEMHRKVFTEKEEIDYIWSSHIYRLPMFICSPCSFCGPLIRHVCTWGLIFTTMFFYLDSIGAIGLSHDGPSHDSQIVWEALDHMGGFHAVFPPHSVLQHWQQHGFSGVGRVSLVPPQECQCQC